MKIAVRVGSGAVPVTQDDQLGYLPVHNRKMESENERISKAPFVVIPVDVCGEDNVVVRGQTQSQVQ